jgi:hypothetical protein
MDVKFLPEAHIERAANELLFAYGQKFGEVTAPPIPAEEILECHLGLSLDFADLRARFGDAHILGAIWIDTKKVLIDQSLDPSGDQRREGRYRFTVGHEAGHWVLHRHQLLEARSAPLFDAKPEPSVICRDTVNKPPIERQADYFASYLLMPEEMVRRQWAEVTGSREPYVAEDEINQLRGRYGLAEDEQPTVEIAKRMARVFRVSGQSMQIRLVGLKLILPQKPPPSLFD